MKKFTQNEINKATEGFSKQISQSKRQLPIQFIQDGRTVRPSFLKTISIDELSRHEKTDVERVISFKTEGEKSYMDVKCTLNKMYFNDQDGNLASYVVPDTSEDVLNIFKIARDLGELFAAFRTSAILALCTRQEFVNGSSIEPPTGAILADILCNGGRIQATAIRDIIAVAGDLEGSKLNAALSEYNQSKATKALKEAIGHISIENFCSGLDAIIKDFPNLFVSSVQTAPKGSAYEPVVREQKESSFKQVERPVITKRKLTSIL